MGRGTVQGHQERRRLSTRERLQRSRQHTHVTFPELSEETVAEQQMVKNMDRWLLNDQTGVPDLEQEPDIFTMSNVYKPKACDKTIQQRLKVSYRPHTQDTYKPIVEMMSLTSKLQFQGRNTLKRSDPSNHPFKLCTGIYL